MKKNWRTGWGLLGLLVIGLMAAGPAYGETSTVDSVYDPAMGPITAVAETILPNIQSRGYFQSTSDGYDLYKFRLDPLTALSGSLGNYDLTKRRLTVTVTADSGVTPYVYLVDAIPADVNTMTPLKTLNGAGSVNAQLTSGADYYLLVENQAGTGSTTKGYTITVKLQTVTGTFPGWVNIVLTAPGVYAPSITQVGLSIASTALDQASDSLSISGLANGAQTAFEISPDTGTYQVDVYSGTYTLLFQAPRFVSKAETGVVVNGYTNGSKTLRKDPQLYAGDVNSDGVIDGVDLLYVYDMIGTVDTVADLDNSGAVDWMDLALLISNYGCRE